MDPSFYVNRFGWRIFPIHGVKRGQCTCGRGDKCASPGKHPRTGKGFNDATTDPTTISRWLRQWGDDTNWGVATGRTSGMFVVDIDPRHNGFQSLEQFETDRPEGSLPVTLTSLTGGGGRHLFFRYPDSGSVPGRQAWLPGVDVKSDGGYVLIPPGSHISGGQYRWRENLLDLIDPVVAPSDLLVSIGDTSSGGTGQGELPDTPDILAGIPEGQRNAVLFKAGCRWRRQHESDPDKGRSVVTALIAAAAAKCTPPYPEDEWRIIVDQVMKQDHTDDLPDWGFVTEEGDKFHNLTDLGNKNRLMHHYGENLKYVPEWGWLEWTAMGWQRVALERLMQYTALIPDVIRYEAGKIEGDVSTRRRWIKHALSTESAGALAAIERLGRNDERVLLNPQSFDANLHELAARNGVIDLRTGEIREFGKDDLLTKNTNILYDRYATSTGWNDFLKESTQGDSEMIEYLQRAAGYTLTGLTTEECFFILSGPTASGKSTFVDAMLTCLGLYSTITQSDTFMRRKIGETARDEMATLAGMRLVGMSEIPEGAVFNVALINQVTGGDRIKAKELYKNPFEFKPQFKLWIATNHDPASQDEALMRRIKRIPFSHTIPIERRDPRLKAMLKDPEVGGRAVLAWAVQGAVKWYTDGLHEPAQVKLAVEEYRVENDAFGRFVGECLVLDPEQEISGRTIYQVYDAWAQANNEYRMRRPQFNQKMKERSIPRSVTDIFIGVRARTMSYGENGVVWL